MDAWHVEYVMPCAKVNPETISTSRVSQVAMMLHQQSVYFSVQSMYIVWLIGQLTQLLATVNPRLGVLTLSLSLAAEDLGNFLLLLGGLLAVYATMGNVVFGTVAEDFSSLSKSFTTCFHMLMGDTAPGSVLRQLTDPLKTVGTVFFWSFMLSCVHVAIELRAGHHLRCIRGGEGSHPQCARHL